MTPAVNLLQKAKVPHQLHSYDHDPGAAAYGEEAADKLGVPHDRLFKTLVALADSSRMVVAVVPVSTQLDLKRLARAVKAKKTKMADKKDVERVTGYLLGGVSPLGQKKRLPTIVDASALNFKTIYVSAGRRGLQVELAPQDLASLTAAGMSQITG